MPVNLLKMVSSLTESTVNLDTDEIERFYIDPSNIEKETALNKILLNKNILVKGRRGTGKSVLLARGYRECLKSFNEEENRLKEKTLGIYINLRSIWIQIEKLQDREETFQNAAFLVGFYQKLNESLSRKEYGGIFPKLKGKINNIFQKNPEQIIKKSLIDIIAGYKVENPQDIEILNNVINDTAFEGGIKISALSMGDFKGKFEKKKEVIEKFSQSRINSLMTALTEIYHILKEVSKISKIFLFFDEYSEINVQFQRFLTENVLNLITTGDSPFFAKIAVYPGKFEIEQLSESREFDQIELDFDNLSVKEELTKQGNFDHNKMYKRRFNKSMSYLNAMLTKRLDYYKTGMKLSEFIDAEALKYLFYASQGVPRNVGKILFNLIDNPSYPIDVDSILTQSTKWYDVCRTELLKIICDIYGKDEKINKDEQIRLWKNIINYAKKNVNKNNNSTHYFYVANEYNEKLKILNASFLINQVGHIYPRTTSQVKGSDVDDKSYSLYSFNMGLSMKVKLVFNKNFDLDYDLYCRTQYDFSATIIPRIAFCEIHGQLKPVDIKNHPIDQGAKICGKCALQDRIKRIEFKTKENDTPIDEAIVREEVEMHKEIDQIENISPFFKKYIKINQDEREIIQILLKNNTPLTAYQISLAMKDDVHFNTIKKEINQINKVIGSELISESTNTTPKEYTLMRSLL